MSARKCHFLLWLFPYFSLRKCFVVQACFQSPWGELTVSLFYLKTQWLAMENQWEFFDVSSNHQVVQMSCRRVKQLNDSSAAWGSLMFFDMIKECKFIVVGFAAEWLFTSVSTSKYVSSNHQAVNISCHRLSSWMMLHQHEFSDVLSND